MVRKQNTWIFEDAAGVMYTLVIISDGRSLTNTYYFISIVAPSPCLNSPSIQRLDEWVTCGDFNFLIRSYVSTT